MTTFDDIYDNALGYRNDFAELIKLTNDLADKKTEFKLVISWFRKRNSLIKNVLEPLSDNDNCKALIKYIKSLKHAKEINIVKINKLIMKVNDSKLVIVEPVNPNYDIKIIKKLANKAIRVCDKIKKRYLMNIFIEPIDTSEIIRSKIINKGSATILYKKSAELFNKTNNAIEIFNKKYWQVSGKRWQRTGTGNKHGYVKVKTSKMMIFPLKK